LVRSVFYGSFYLLTWLSVLPGLVPQYISVAEKGSSIQNFITLGKTLFGTKLCFFSCTVVYWDEHNHTNSTVL
jgi:hypothetical protein